MAITHPSKHKFHFHLLTLTLIFILILTSTFIAVKEWRGWGVDTPIVLGSLSLIIWFVYAICVASTYSHIKRPMEEHENPNRNKPYFNHTGYGSKRYDQISPTYNNEAEEST